MYEFYPLLIVGGVIGLMSAIFIIAFCSIKDRKEAIGFDRNMKDSELIKRLFVYAKPHAKSFLAVFLIMLFSISYDIISPTLVGNIEEKIKGDFVPSELRRGLCRHPYRFACFHLFTGDPSSKDGSKDTFRAPRGPFHPHRKPFARTAHLDARR